MSDFSGVTSSRTPFRETNLLIVWIVTAAISVPLIVVDVRRGPPHLLQFLRPPLDPTVLGAWARSLVHTVPLLCIGAFVLPALSYVLTKLVLRSREKYLTSSKRGSVTTWWKQLSD
jgi:hypothetical protein